MNRDMSDNLLVKAQGLMNLLQSGIPKQYALPVINLFSDSNAVVQAMEKEETKKQEIVQDNQNNIQQQNNQIKDVEEKENQEQ